MKRDVFISYSSMDKHVADAICTAMESSGIRCWIAPRDIIPGSDWAQSIISGIKSSRIMVLVFSHNSNGSSQVTKELNLAVSNNLMVVPFKIDDSVPSGSMEYYLADMHWLDAINGDIQEQINVLLSVVRRVLAIPMDPQPTPVPQPAPNPLDVNIPSFISGGDNHNTQPTPQPIPQPVPQPEPQPQPAPNPLDVNIPSFIPGGDNHNTQPTPQPIPQPEPQPAPTGKINIIGAYKRLWTRFFDYKGCATRSEYWLATLANFVMTFVVTILNAVLYNESPVFLFLYAFAASIGFISMGVRRLHDTNRSGHWMWLLLTGYGSIALLVFFCFPSIEVGNRFKKQ